MGQQEIIKIMQKNPKKHYNIEELAEKTKISRRAIGRCIVRLEKQNIIKILENPTMQQKLKGIRKEIVYVGE